MSDLNDKLEDLLRLKPRVAKLEKQFKKLKKFVMDALGYLSQNHSPCRDEEDAMFTKKPLLGNSCASCDKDIINLIGRGADFYPWQKFPSRDLTEKISKGKVSKIRLDRPNSAVKVGKKNRMMHFDDGLTDMEMAAHDYTPEQVRIRRNLKGRNMQMLRDNQGHS